MKYVVVVPVKNEEKFIEGTIISIVEQTIKPQLCLFVDDMSTDSTPDIIHQFSSQFDYLKYYRYQRASSQNKYRLGGHVVNLFLTGKKIIDRQSNGYDYIVKLDGDVKFASDFIESIWNKIGDERFGIVSGTPYYVRNHKKVYYSGPEWHSRGQFKIYSRDCLEQIGGPPLGLGWDCADNVQAIEMGWKTRAFRKPEYLMGRAIGGKFSDAKGRVNHGIGAYKLGYHPIYFFMRIIYNLFKAPYLTGAFYLLYGYATSALSHTKKTLTVNQIKLLRRLHLKELIEKTLHYPLMPFALLYSATKTRTDGE